MRSYRVSFSATFSFVVDALNKKDAGEAADLLLSERELIEDGQIQPVFRDPCIALMDADPVIEREET